MLKKSTKTLLAMGVVAIGGYFLYKKFFSGPSASGLRVKLPPGITADSSYVSSVDPSFALQERVNMAPSVFDAAYLQALRDTGGNQVAALTAANAAYAAQTAPF